MFFSHRAQLAWNVQRDVWFCFLFLSCVYWHPLVSRSEAHLPCSIQNALSCWRWQTSSRALHYIIWIKCELCTCCETYPVCYIVWSNYPYLPCPGKTAELICVGYGEAGLIKISDLVCVKLEHVSLCNSISALNFCSSSVKVTWIYNICAEFLLRRKHFCSFIQKDFSFLRSHTSKF